MPKLTQALPRYRKHRASGQAVVTLSGVDHYLGPHGTKTSKLEYDRLVAEWLQNGRQLRAPADGVMTVIEVIAAYLRHAELYYRKGDRQTSEYPLVVNALRILGRLYGHSLVTDFGPLSLQTVRQRMIDRDLSRGVINKDVGRIRRMFKWAASEELIPAAVPQSLTMLAGLRRGRMAVRETTPVRPVTQAAIDATLPHLPVVVADMVRLQRFTGMRPDEVCSIRPCEVDRTGDVWTYRPASHKTQHHSRDRVILMGPRAQSILRRYLARDAADYCFRPADSEAKRRALQHAGRKTPLSCGNKPGSNRVRKPQHPPGDHYTTGSYRHAIHRACDKAFPHAKLAGVRRADLTAEQAAELTVYGGGIDQVYGDDGADHLYGDQGVTVLGSHYLVGQRLWGGAGIDYLYAYAEAFEPEQETQPVGDELHGGLDGDWLYGNLRSEQIWGDGGNDVLFGDYLRGPFYSINPAAISRGANDKLFGGGGEDRLYGGGGDDELWGGGDSDSLDGQGGNDKLYGGLGIDELILDVVSANVIETYDGYFGNEVQDPLGNRNDDATDFLRIDGTPGNDAIYIGQKASNDVSANLLVSYAGRRVEAKWKDATGAPLIEQFRVAGLSGDDDIQFVLSANEITPTAGPNYTLYPLDVSRLSARGDDWVGVIDGGAGNDILRGSNARDRIDGEFGSDVLYGMGGDDQLWGDGGKRPIAIVEQLRRTAFAAFYDRRLAKDCIQIAVTIYISNRNLFRGAIIREKADS